MRPDFLKPLPDDRPLISDVERLESPQSGSHHQESRLGEGALRDETIILLLREKLKDRGQGNAKNTLAGTSGHSMPGGDKYEPQRLGRKICWQYDNNARRVPMLRRPYI